MSHRRKPLPLDEPAMADEKVSGPPSAADRGPDASSDATPLAEPLTEAQIVDLKDRIVAALCNCFDPEIPVNIYELGLIYDILIAPSGEVVIRMTLTSPACPVAGTLPGDVQRRVQMLPNVTAVKVETVWDPPWDKDRMSEAAKLQLGID
jgi:FeS assembly SUF system protein